MNKVKDNMRLLKFAIPIAITVALAGCGDDSPEIKASTLDDVGRFIEHSKDITPTQRKELINAVLNLQYRYVIDKGMSPSLKKDLGEYFDGMHVNEIIKKGGAEKDLDAQGQAQKISTEYYRAGGKVN